MSFIFRATRYIGRHLKTFTSLPGLRYCDTSSAQPTKLLGLNVDSTDSTVSSSSDAELSLTLPVFTLPTGFKPKIVQLPEYIEKALSPLVDTIDRDPETKLYLSLDAEWNISRRTGVSILQLCPHIDPPVVYIVIVHRLTSLPPSLLRLLTSDRVWKIGSQIKGDLTRLRKQFSLQLHSTTQFSTIDLKEYALSKGIIQRKQTATLAALCETVLGLHLPKDPDTRVNNNWESATISPRLLHYAACDVMASRQIFETMARPEEREASMEDETMAASSTQSSLLRFTTTFSSL